MCVTPSQRGEQFVEWRSDWYGKASKDQHFAMERIILDYWYYLLCTTTSGGGHGSLNLAA